MQETREQIYCGLTGGYIAEVLNILGVLHVKDVYTHYGYKSESEAFKNEYSLTKRIVCNIENKYNFEVFQYYSAYYLKIENNLLTIYDLNQHKKYKYVVLLKDKELKKIQKTLIPYRSNLEWIVNIWC
jgi:hypothetical protein